MGMDFAELALEIEERYIVEFEDDDWASMQTFGDVIDTVKRKIDRPLDLSIEESGNEIILQSLLAELRLRLPQNVEINEETRLHKLRRYVKNCGDWSSLQQRFPELPGWRDIGFRRIYQVSKLIFSGFVAIVVFWLITFLVLSEYFGENLWTLLAAIIPWLGITFFWLYLTLSHSPPRTVGDVAKAVAKRQQKLLKVRGYSSEDIENELRIYMSEAFTLKPEKIRRESDLVKDLGLS